MKQNQIKTMALLMSIACTAAVVAMPTAVSKDAIAVFAAESETLTYTDANSNAFEYTIQEDGTLCLTAATPAETTETLTVPAEIDGKPVTVLYDFFLRGSTISGIVLPDTLREICTTAFYYCCNLTEIQIPESVTKIHSAAFYYCTSLTRINLPQNLTELPSSTFFGCYALSDIVIPENNALTEIGSYAFHSTAWLEKQSRLHEYVIIKDILVYTDEADAVIPNSVSRIAGGAIGESVRTVRIPNHITSIAAETLSDLSLEEIYYEGTQDEWNAIYTTEDDTLPILFAGEPDCSRGDVDANGNIDVSDAVAVLNFYAKQSAGLEIDAEDGMQPEAGDVNEYNDFEVEDAIFILTYYAQRSAACYPSWDTVLYGEHMQRPEISLANYGTSVKINWEADSQADGYEIYRQTSTETEPTLLTTISDSSTIAYEDTGLDAEEEYWYSVRPYRVRYERTQRGRESAQQNSASKNAILNSVDLQPHDTFVCYDCSEDLNSTEVMYTYKLTDNDKKILDAFAAEHFTPDMTREEQLMTTMQWIFDNNNYAYVGEKWDTIVNKTLTEAIFTYKLGQCLQYNGALASMMAYMGYDVNLIFLRNSETGWQHFTCRVHINGKTYEMETGNKERGPYISLLEPAE